MIKDQFQIVGIGERWTTFRCFFCKEEFTVSPEDEYADNLKNLHQCKENSHARTCSV